MKYQCEFCGNIHEGILDSCPKCGLVFECLLDKVSFDKEGFQQLKSVIVERLSYELMVGEDKDCLTIAFPYESLEQLVSDYKNALEQIGSYVDHEDVVFLDRCLYNVEWVLDYAVLSFSFEGLDSLGKGSIKERLGRALGFDDSSS